MPATSISSSAVATRRAFHPGLVTARFYESWDFYTTHLGFRTVFENHTFVQLEHPDGPRLSLQQQECETERAALVSATDGRGWWLELAVEDVEQEFARLQDAGVEPLSAIEMTPQGERRFFVRDPNGVLIALCSAASDGGAR